MNNNRVCTVCVCPQPGHIIAWYIDFLIHENEDRTQISRAFTLPVNLFHTEDFYFLDSLRKKVSVEMVLEVNPFHSDDFYFLDSLRKKVSVEMVLEVNPLHLEDFYFLDSLRKKVSANVILEVNPFHLDDFYLLDSLRSGRRRVLGWRQRFIQSRPLYIQLNKVKFWESVLLVPLCLRRVQTK